MKVDIDIELAGWCLFWAELETSSESPDLLAHMCSQTTNEVRENLERESLTKHPTVATLRTLFKRAGCQPSRYRPSSEALLRRLLKGDPMPEISTLVDLNNCLSARLAVPCCVMAEGTFSGPFLFRAGLEGESYESLKGPFRLENKPLLLDSLGPCDTPITGSLRVKVAPETTRATLVAYLPEDVVSPDQATAALDSLIAGLSTTRALDTTSAR